MAERRRRTNLFYVLLIATGLAFAITACGFGVMTFRGLQGPESLGSFTEAPAGQWANHPLLEFLDKYGIRIMLIELTVLALATVGCIVTDTRYERLAAARGGDENQANGESKEDESIASVES